MHQSDSIKLIRCGFLAIIWHFYKQGQYMKTHAIASHLITIRFHHSFRVLELWDYVRDFTHCQILIFVLLNKIGVILFITKTTAHIIITKTVVYFRTKEATTMCIFFMHIPPRCSSHIWQHFLRAASSTTAIIAQNIIH